MFYVATRHYESRWRRGDISAIRVFISRRMRLCQLTIGKAIKNDLIVPAKSQVCSSARTKEARQRLNASAIVECISRRGLKAKSKQSQSKVKAKSSLAHVLFLQLVDIDADVYQARVDAFQDAVALMPPSAAAAAANSLVHKPSAINANRQLAKLAVEPQQVVLGKTEATDGCVGFQATMWPMPIVAVEPVEHLGRSLVRVVIGASIGPFAQCCLDKALGLSIGPRGVGLRLGGGC